MNKKLLLACATLFLSSPLLALDSGWLELKEGSLNESGIQIQTITPTDKGQKVHFSIPKSTIKDGDPQLEEIIIIGKPTNNKKPPHLFKNVDYEWAKNFEGDNYGLIVTFKEKSRYPIRLYFAKDAATISP